MSDNLNQNLRTTTPLWALILFLFVFAARLDVAEADSAIHGTLISAFGNQNGLVVVTDSMGTFKDSSGNIRHHGPFQKLFKYDDRTVCAVAGLGTVVVPEAPNLNSAILGIISSYRDEVKTKDIREPIQSALTHISVLLQFYLETVAEINAVSGHTGEISNYYLEVLMVGYDLDGRPKIGELALLVEGNSDVGTQTKWKASEVQNQVTTVEKTLTYKLKGIKGMASLILENPELRSDSAIVKAYAAAQKSDVGASFTLDQMEKLQSEMARITADIHEDVGGDKQVAVLKDGKISRFDQPDFPEPQKPFSLAVLQGGGVGRGRGIVIRGKVVKFYNSVHFDDAGRPPDDPIMLDGNVFVNCVFENTNVIYDGGSLYLDKTNRTINSHVLWDRNARRRPDIMKSLNEIFGTH